MRKLTALAAFVVFACMFTSFAQAETLSPDEKSMSISKRTEIRLLIEDLGNHREAQAAAVEKLVEIGGSAVPMLIRYSDHENEHIRAYVAFVLGRIGDTRGIEPLANLLGDSSYYVAYYAEKGLQELAHANMDAALLDVVDHLKTKLTVDSDVVRSRAVVVLMDLNPIDLWETMVGLLKDDYWKVRADAAKALGGISTATDLEQKKQIAQALENALADNEWQVVRSVALAAGFYIHDSGMYIIAEEDSDGNFKGYKDSPNKEITYKLIDRLVRLIEHEEPTVRSAAALSLGKVWITKAEEKEAAVMGALIKGLDDKNEDVVISAAISLGKNGNKTAVGALIERLDLDKHSPLVINYMIDALRKRTLKNFGYQGYPLLEESEDNPIDTPDEFDAALEKLEQDRRQAIEKWKTWWQGNSNAFEVNPTIR